MCGIFAYIECGDEISHSTLCKSSFLQQHRGPDNTVNAWVSNEVFFSFHRLSINDLSNNGNQPIFHPQDNNIICMCNGEIYNYYQLVQEYKLDVYSSSDCEVIVHLYKRFGIAKTIDLLDGVFAFVLYDKNKDKFFAARDPFGVRPLFTLTSDTTGNIIAFSSEAKPLLNLPGTVKIFPPGSWLEYGSKCVTYFKYDNIPKFILGKKTLKNIFVNSVTKRLLSDRPIGCLLSGGLDSSLVAGILAKELRKKNEYLTTFSIGMKGATDLHYAKIVANHIKSKHHHVEFTPQEGLDAIKQVIYSLESYDITTVRASVGMYLISKYINQKTNIKVVFSGEGSDEVCQGYIYFHKAPSNREGAMESIRLIKDLHMFDVLRSDRTIAAHGLEARVPFLDKEFVTAYLGLDDNLKAPLNNIEKYYLRELFKDDKIIPNEILWRPKEAFSDGVSGLKKSWYQIIQDHVNTLVTDYDFNYGRLKYKHNTPRIKEAYYYRKIFDSFFSCKHKDADKLIDYYWLPKWSNTVDPSARVLNHYKQ